MQLILLLFNFIKCILVRQGTGFQLLGADAHVLKLDLEYLSWRQRPFAQPGPKRGVMLVFLVQNHFCSRIDVWKTTGFWSVHFRSLQTDISSRSAHTCPWPVVPSKAHQAEVNGRSEQERFGSQLPTERAPGDKPFCAHLYFSSCQQQAEPTWWKREAKSLQRNVGLH